MGRCHLHPDMGRGVTRRAAPVHPFGQHGPLSSSSSCMATLTLQVRVPKRGGGLGE